MEKQHVRLGGLHSADDAVENELRRRLLKIYHGGSSVTGNEEAIAGIRIYKKTPTGDRASGFEIGLLSQKPVGTQRDVYGVPRASPVKR